MTLYPCRFPLRASLGSGIQETEMTSGDFATARTLSGGRDGTTGDTGDRESVGVIIAVTFWDNTAIQMIHWVEKLHVLHILATTALIFPETMK